MIPAPNLRRIKGNSQLTEFLAELPGIRADPVDGILAEMKFLQHQQAIKPAFGNLCEVIMVQLPAMTIRIKAESKVYYLISSKGKYDYNLCHIPIVSRCLPSFIWRYLQKDL